MRPAFFGQPGGALLQQRAPAQRESPSVLDAPGPRGAHPAPYARDGAGGPRLGEEEAPMAQPVVRHCPAGRETLPKPRSPGRGGGGAGRDPEGSVPNPLFPVVAESQGLPRPLGPRRREGKKHLRLTGAISRPLRAFDRGRAACLPSSPAQTRAARGASSPPLYEPPSPEPRPAALPPETH